MFVRIRGELRDKHDRRNPSTNANMFCVALWGDCAVPLSSAMPRNRPTPLGPFLSLSFLSCQLFTSGLSPVAFHHSPPSLTWQKAPRSSILAAKIANFPWHTSCWFAQWSVMTMGPMVFCRILNRSLFSPTRARRLLHAPALSWPSQPLRSGTRPSPCFGLAALSTSGKPVMQVSLVSRIFYERCRMSLFVAVIFVGCVACERTPDQVPEVKNAVVADRPGVLRLTSEELARTAIEAARVARGEVRVPGEFPATVQPNQNELAHVTTLIRGRVVQVHVDVGQDVKKDTQLALLHSTDLGVAEGTYLKSAAKLHEKELAYERAKDLYEQKVVSLAEL